MFFELGKFYGHEAGRQIAVVGEVNTYKWGKMLIIEEADPTGHSISCVEAGEDVSESVWVEIAKHEFMENFK